MRAHKPHRLAMLAMIVVGTSAAMAAEPTQVKLVAYINLASGCQVPTETFLRDLAETYEDRVILEFVDFGTPAGKKRWRGDGMHCMAITVDGSTDADIVTKGAEINVSFKMPVGHLWLHDELATAVRQKLDGVQPVDKIAPAISVKTKGTQCDVLAGDEIIVANVDQTKAKTMADILIKAAEAKVLTQDDFSLAPCPAGALVSVRGETLFEVARVDESDDEFGRRVVQTFLSLMAPFPRISRPFPGMKQPQQQRRR